MNKIAREFLSIIAIGMGIPGCIIFYMRYVNNGYKLDWYFVAYIVSALLLIKGFDVRYRNVQK